MAGRARGRARDRRARAGGEPQGHDSRSTCVWPSCCSATAAGSGTRSCLNRAWIATAMLTDYHLHLRPDDARRDAPERFFTAGNVERYRDAAPSAGSPSSASPSTSTASTRRSSSGATPSGSGSPSTTSTPTATFVREQTDLRLGLEADFVAGRGGPHGEPARGARLRLRRRLGPFHPRRRGRHGRLRRVGLQTAVQRRGGLVGATSRRSPTARSGLFDILAHPDLVKDVGRGADPARDPIGDLRRYYEPAVEAIAESGVAVEVSTAGLRKPVGEIYPLAAFLEMCLEARPADRALQRRAPPADVGADYDRRRSCSARSACESCPFSSTASGGWSRSGPRHERRPRLRLAPPRRGASS